MYVAVINDAARATGAKRTRKRPLSRARVLDAAIALADDGGIDALSSDGLARELGVEAMSLYNHVAKQGRDPRCGSSRSIAGESGAAA